MFGSNLKPAVHIREMFDDKIMNKMLFGGVAGFMSVSILYPVDTIRARLQEPNVGSHRVPSKFQRLHPALRRVVGSNVFRGSLYTGIGLNLMAVVPEKALKFGVNDSILAKIKESRPVSLADRIMAGAVAGTAQSVITTPLEQTKIRMQLFGNKFWPTMKTIRNPYRGLGLVLWRDVPFTSIFFPTFCYLRKFNFTNNPLADDLISGWGAGVASTVPVTPVDVIKTQYQSSDTNSIKQIVKELDVVNKPSVLFRGWVPRVVAVCSMYSICAAVFELQKRWF